MTGAAVVCRGVGKSYPSAAGPVPAVSGADLEVSSGEVVFLVGPSGCGKTTLISIIAGVLRRDTGDCRILGTDLDTLSPAAASAFRRRHIGFVFQAFNLIPTLTAQENVAVPMLLNGASGSTARRAAQEALETVELGAHAAKRPSQLSGGQQQRVALARAIVHAPALVVCDEPTSALDHRTGMEVMRLLRRLAHERGGTLLVVTHDHRIYDFADRIAEMDDGRVLRIDAPRPHEGSTVP